MMLTLLPFPSFRLSAQALSEEDLSRSLRSTMEIAAHLTLHKHDFVRHPAVQMWKGFERALAEYGLALCEEGEKRGVGGLKKRKDYLLELTQDLQLKLPPWLGDVGLHANHRALLLYSDSFYRRIKGWKEVPTSTVVWPKRNG